MNIRDLQREAHQSAKSGSFADLQEQAALALASKDIVGARATIRAMKEFVAMAERDLEKLIAWTRSSGNRDRGALLRDSGATTGARGVVVTEHWYSVRDGDPRVRGMLNRHYSAIRYLDGRRPLKSLGPGEYLLLMTADSRAVFGWIRNTVERKDGQVGVYCSLFRNEGSVLSSELIREACELAWRRWPGQRLFTYVDARKVKSPNPGYCFKRAGWQTCRQSKGGKTLLELVP